LGKIICNIPTKKCDTVGVALLGDPVKIVLSEKGKIVKKHIENCNKKLNNVFVDEYIIMPNHVHIIISLIGSPRSATPTIPTIVNSYKSIVSKEIGYSIWQRNYYEHIIRNEKEYLKVKEYIINNPAQWAEDKYYLK